MLDVGFWQGRYESGQTAWDLGGPSPHWQTLLACTPVALPPGKMAVLGAGRGHDAVFFAQKGFTVTGFDYAPLAVQEANARYGDQVSFVQADLFGPEVASPQSEWAGAFDYVLEHTCFCAIHPKQRAAYVETVKNILKPNGLLLGIFWEHSDEDGPPFPTSQHDIERFFGADFECLFLEGQTPVNDRMGVEYLTVLRRK